MVTEIVSKLPWNSEEYNVVPHSSPVVGGDASCEWKPTREEAEEEEKDSSMFTTSEQAWKNSQFSVKWLLNPEYKDWLVKYTGQINKAKCYFTS